MRTGIWPEILWNSLLFCLWKALEAPSVSSRLSLYFFVCLSPHACVCIQTHYPVLAGEESLVSVGIDVLMYTV